MAARAAAAERARRGPGRPPNVIGDDTRGDIRRVASRLFATHGYNNTTTRMISEEVGVTPAALHHYFGRKINLVLTLWHSTTDVEYARLNDVVDRPGTFVEKVQRLIGATLEALRTDLENTRFIASIREEARRTAELAEIVEDKRLGMLVRKLVKYGVDTGAVDKQNAAAARGAISAMMLGITMLAAEVTPQRIEQMAEGCRMLVNGDLFRAV